MSAKQPTRKPTGKRKESDVSAQEGRERKRAAKRKGLKAGSRQQVEQSNNKSGNSQSKDPRIGSRKPVELVVAAPVKAKPVASKPLKSAEQLEQERLAKLRGQQEKELAEIEGNERLNSLLDRLDEGLAIAVADEEWLEQMLDRHQVLLAELGIEDEDDDEPSEPDDLLERFINDEFDPSEIDPEYKSNKQK